MRKRILALFVVLICAACNFSACNNKDAKYVLSTGFKNNEIFRLDKESCYRYEALIYLANTANEYKSIYGEKIFTNTENATSIKDKIRQVSFSKLMKVKIMNLMAEDYDIELDDSEESTVKEISENYYNSLTDEEKRTFDNVSKNEIEDMVREYTIANKVYQYVVKDINKEISDDEARTVVVKEIYIPLNDEEYDSNLNDNNSTDKLKLAEDVYVSIISGNEFDSVAMEYSKYGDAMLSYRKGQLDAELEKVVFNLSEGQMSELVTAGDGYHVFYCINPFSRDDTEANRKNIIAKRERETFEKEFEKYVESSCYYVNEEVFDKILFDEDIEKTSTCIFFKLYENELLALD